MQYTTLGRTNLRVSRLGFGCMRLPMRGSSVDRDLAIPMLRRAVELGVTYFDTAVGYCSQDSQRVLGEALEGMRDRVVLSTKNPHYNKQDERGWWTNLENSLERLRTGHIDLYNFHALGWKRFQDHVGGPDGQFRWMQRAKDQGLIRHIGCSCHDNADGLRKLAETGCFEAVTLQYNLLDRTHEPALEFVAEKCRMGVIVMGPVGGGRLGGESEELRRMLKGARSVPEVALRFVLSNPHVSVALSGMTELRQVEENVKIAARKTPLSAAEKRRVAAILVQFKKLAELYCTGCRYCMPCPRGVDIPGNFSALNYDRVYGLKALALKTYERLAAPARYCMACGACASKCPQKLDIVGQLRQTMRTLDDVYGKIFASVTTTALKELRATPRGWSAEIEGKLDLLNMSDNPVEAAFTFEKSRSAQVIPPERAAKLDSFERKCARLLIRCSGGRFSGAVDTGAKPKPGGAVELRGKVFHAAFAPSAGKSASQALRRAVPILLGLPEQASPGAERKSLRGHRAVCRFAHDSETLYFLADVKDDLRAPASASRRTRDTDRLTVCIDARPAGQIGQPGHGGRLLEIDLLAPGSEKLPLLRVESPAGVAANLASCKCRRVKGGYRIEAALPWAMIEIPKAQRRRLRVQVILASPNRAAEQDVKIHWTGATAGRKPEEFGHLFLAD